MGDPPYWYYRVRLRGAKGATIPLRRERMASHRTGRVGNRRRWIGRVFSVLYSTLSFITPEDIANGVTANFPQPDPAIITSPEQAAMVERGRYLFKVISCNMCHGQTGSGGQKISWLPAGTHWTRNLTPHSKAGLGAWSGKEIARAIRSGVSRDGRPLHCKGWSGIMRRIWKRKTCDR